MSLSLLSAWETKAQGCGGLSQKECKPFIFMYWLLHMGHWLKSLFWPTQSCSTVVQSGWGPPGLAFCLELYRKSWRNTCSSLVNYPWCGGTKITYLQRKLALTLQSEVKHLPDSRGLISLLKWIMRALQKRWDLFSFLATLRQVRPIKILPLRSNWLICLTL